MADTPHGKRIATAKEHLAGLKAAATWHQELAEAHLLRSQAPIGEQPVTPETTTEA